MKRHLFCLLFAVACQGTDIPGRTSRGIQRIPCQSTTDCARGGTCVAAECVAGNECAVDADCVAGEVCTADVNFGGLCGPAGAAPVPAPVVTAEDCANQIDDDGDGAIDCSDIDCARAPACVPPIENCANQIDDDGDGDADCADADCAAACAEDCANQIDDDGDGDADCADADCATDPACAPPGEDCANQIDDDGDGDVDCADIECVREPVCQGSGCNGSNCPCDVILQNCAMPAHRCYPGGPDSADGQCYPTGGRAAGDACIEPPVNTPDSCDAGLLCIYEGETDPTGICRTICASSADCAGGDLCYALFPQPTNYGICHPPPGETCSNGTDDDGDGDVDCADADCAQDPVCAPPPPPEDCANGIDDDLDGDADCADADCARHPACP
jgi:hypothetical protein